VAIIPLGRRLPDGSGRQPEGWRGQRYPHLGLAPGGVCRTGRSPGRGCRSTFSPVSARLAPLGSVSFLWHFPRLAAGRR